MWGSTINKKLYAVIFCPQQKLIKNPDCSDFTGFLSRRPKEQKYKMMILGLADAIEPSPFFLQTAAAYLRDWVNGTLQLVPPLDVSILAAVSARPVCRSDPVSNTVPVAALEPNVSDVRIDRANSQTPQDVVTNPRMEVICGIAKTLHKEGVDWTDAFRKAYELWDKLNPNVKMALEVNSVGAVAESNTSPDPSAVENLEDDTMLPLQPEVDYDDR